MLDGYCDRIREFLGPILEEQGADLVDLEVKRVQRKILVRILIDLPQGGITIGQCTKVNKALSRILDEQNVIGSDFFLEVCSPGIDWPLKSAKDFLRVVGRPVRMTLSEPLNQKREYSGKVETVKEDQVIIESAGASCAIPLNQIKNATQMI